MPVAAANCTPYTFGARHSHLGSGNLIGQCAVFCFMCTLLHHFVQAPSSGHPLAIIIIIIVVIWIIMMMTNIFL